ncbi:MAG TPA: cation:proton antiporter [Nitrosopumilaceae archaeon]|nr:cation:proton antiporter [Nitrosopumilaceae archaeon]
MQEFFLQTGPFNLPVEDFIRDLAIIMILASVVTLAFFKIRQPLIIGYLFAGILIGPLSPLWTSFLPASIEPSSGIEGLGLLSDLTVLNIFADIGIILLLFVIGIEFPIAKIKSIGRVSIGIASIELFLSLGIIFLVSISFGLNFMDSLFIAAALSISSTAIIIKIFEDMGKIKKESSILVLGILIIEDIIAVILIASLQSVVRVGDVSYENIITISAIAALLIIGTLTIGAKIIPRLIDRVASSEHKEILLISVLGLCFGYALLSNLIGLSVGIGAFLAGVLVAESKSAEISKILASPIKDMFAAIFFVSVGALMDISQLQNYVLIAVVLIAVSIVIKCGGTMFGGILFRQGRKKTIRSSLALSPRGEFSIFIVKVGVDMGAVSTFLFPLIGIISIITAFVTPFMMRAGDQLLLKTSKVPEP